MMLQKAIYSWKSNYARSLFLVIFFIFPSNLSSNYPICVEVGIDCLFQNNQHKFLKNKHIGLITNQTSINREFKSTLQILQENRSCFNYEIIALFAPEHGVSGAYYASELIEDVKDQNTLPVYSLHGNTKRPTQEMLKGIDLLIFDIQDLGSRSYTYITTMFYAMEEAAKHKICFLVLDRPNPINGLTVDGPIVEEKWRSFLGYVSIPYCHGMTAGELALFFNKEYAIGCKLDVIPMKGWKRNMTFADTGLPWIPTSPYIPEPTTPLYYPTTGILGELRLVNIGIGYTLPFKVVGAPWIDSLSFTRHLNAQKFPGVHFEPFSYRPFYGRYAKEICHGVFIMITNPLTFKPISTQYLLLGMLKSLYPQKFQEAMEHIKKNKELLCKLNGTEEAFKLILEEKHIVWKLCELQTKEKEAFIKKRQEFLLPAYQ